MQIKIKSEFTDKTKIKWNKYKDRNNMGEKLNNNLEHNVFAVYLFIFDDSKN